MIYALLDGEAATGAYRFDLAVGQESTLDVKATIVELGVGEALLSFLDEKGRPKNVKPVTPEGTLIYPGNQGGTNWYSPSFSPHTGLFYIPSWMDTYSTYIKRPVEYAEGQRFTGALPASRIAVRSAAVLAPATMV